MIERRQAGEPHLAQQGEVYGEGQGAQAGVGADVAGRLLPADVLLAGRQGQHEAPAPVHVGGFADQAPRHLAQVLLPRRQHTYRRAAEVERVAQGLALDGDDVGAHLARGPDRAQGHDLRDHHHQQCPGGVARVGEGGEIRQVAEKRRVLDDHAGGPVVHARGQVFAAPPVGLGGRHLDAEEPGHGLRHLPVVGMKPARQHHLFAFGDACRHHHRLGAGRGPVVQGGVGDLHPGNQRHLCLEFEQIGKGALGDFRLIGGIRREELSPLDQVVDGGGHMMTIGAGAEEGRHVGGTQVPRRHGGERVLHLHLAQVFGQLDGPIPARLLGNVDEQIVDRADTDGGQHLAAVAVGEWQIAHYERLSTYSW